MSKDNPAFDPDFLRNKYREERDKRLNTAGIKQYLEIKENLSFLKDHDPYQKVLSRDLINNCSITFKTCGLYVIGKRFALSC